MCCDCTVRSAVVVYDYYRDCGVYLQVTGHDSENEATNTPIRIRQVTTDETD